VPVLNGVSMEIRAGAMVALRGASGSGKSTLLHLLGGLDVPDSGEISVGGFDPRLEEDRLELRRRHIGFFQLHNLIADLTVDENIRVPAWPPVGRPARRRRNCASWRMRRDWPPAPASHRGNIRWGASARGPLPRTDEFAATLAGG